MAKKGLRAWVKENWVDIANKKSCGCRKKKTSEIKYWPDTE
jgi:hypothetical protein